MNSQNENYKLIHYNMVLDKSMSLSNYMLKQLVKIEPFQSFSRVFKLDKKSILH